MTPKSEHLQVRVTPAQKAALKRLSARSGQDLSSYVLSRALPEGRTRFAGILRSLSETPEPSFALAELSDFLWSLAPVELTEAVGEADPGGLSAFLRNYVAAMVELACHGKGVAPPSWAAAVPGLEEPYFAAPLKSLRLHLLKSSPVAFKRRNLFVDSSVGGRV